MNNLTCPYCKISYDSSQRLPLLFTQCGHSFCKQCIQELIEDENIICPEDGELMTTYKIDLGIKNFPIN